MKRTHVSLLLLLFILLLAACQSQAQPEATVTPIPTPEWELAGWTLVWQDEFDGTEIDPANWTFDIGGHGWGNNEIQAYTDRPENARIEDGMLVFCLFGKTTVTYHNPSRRDTYSGLEVDKIVLTLKSGEEVSFSDGVVPAPYAQQVRSGEAATLDLYFMP